MTAKVEYKVVFERTIKLIAGNQEESNPLTLLAQPSASLVRLGLSDLDIFEVVTDLQECYGFSATDQDIELLGTVNDLVHLVMTKTGSI